ncbi:MAG: 3-oxoacyl-[acyl-carrier-protein] reductase [Ignavibacteriae bacterium]|nr:3-oxoacyl-[acyl-carrier-protein] reductase [Ignavibacteria bacterium]MBI3364380.1 3-oxoacyl-[acyl-carrier-protein] reductase [Ignavibacteriota bacterium]
MLDDKVALVTGGSRGIGRAIAVALADAGAHVMIVYRRAAEEAECVADEIKKKGRSSVAFQGDVAVYIEAKDIVDKVVVQYNRLDILVNNAGITKDGLLMRMTEEDWDGVINTNLKSVFNVTKAAIRPMMTQRSGKIINITSVSGIIGNAGQANYAASKAGMIGFTKSLAKELGSRNIQVNAVAPGFVETDMTAKLTDEQRQKLAEIIPLRRTAKPEEIAGVVRFLASSDADYITGQVICVDGGMVM